MRIPIVFAPLFFWKYALGKGAELLGLDKYQSPEGRRYNEQNFERAKKGLKDSLGIDD